jgi:hypothetical protein
MPVVRSRSCDCPRCSEQDDADTIIVHRPKISAYPALCVADHLRTSADMGVCRDADIVTLG